MKNIVLIITALLCLTMDLYPQETNWESYTNGEHITSICDAGNSIWIGTWGGLVVINKSNDSILFYNKTNSRLNSNFIQTIAIEENGTVWIGTFSEVYSFNGADWVEYNSSNSGLPNDLITTIYIDKNNTKWIGTNSGLTTFSGDSWTTYDTTNSLLPSNKVSAIVCDDYGTLWIGTSDEDSEGGLTAYDGTDWFHYNTPNNDLTHISCIAIDDDGLKWIGTPSRYDNIGLYTFDSINWTIYNMTNSSLPTDYIFSIQVDESGTKWIGTEKGLVSYNDSEWSVHESENPYEDDPFNTINHILSIAIDSTGLKWVGTRHGLLTYDDSDWTVRNSSNSGLVSNYITAIDIDIDGSIWFATSGGISKLKDDHWTAYHSSDIGANINGGDGFSCIEVDNNGNKWVGINNGVAMYDNTIWTIHGIGWGVSTIETDNSGLIWVGKNNMRSRVMYFDGDEWASPSASIPGEILSLAVDQNNTKWFGAWGGGLTAFDDHSSVTYNYILDSIPHLYSISAIDIDPQGGVWFGNNGIDHNNLVCFDGITWKVFDTDNSGLSDGQINCITIDNEGTKWIGTTKGLVSFNDNDWVTYNMKNSGLVNNDIRAIKIDNNGTKWIGTGGGVALFNENGIPSGVQNQLKRNQSLIIYPNPATNYIHIELSSEEKIKTVEFINIQGKVISTMFGSSSTKMDFPINNIKNGFYLLKVTTNNGIQTGKIIIE